MSPAALRATAARLRAVAASLPFTLRPVAAAYGPDVWRGPAAKVFAEELSWHEVQMRKCVLELDAVADRLVARAAQIEQSGEDVGQTGSR